MPYWIFGAISSFGMAFMALILMLSFGHFHSQKFANILLALLSGFFEGIGTVALYRALASGPASLVMPLFALYPAVTIVLSFIFLKERLSLMQTTGICLTFVAAILIAGDKSSDASISQHGDLRIK
jgi:uncharacterized membrane protein